MISAGAQEALAIARELDDPALIARALMACGMGAVYSAEVAQVYFGEAIDLVRAAGDRWSLCQIFSYPGDRGRHGRGAGRSDARRPKQGRDLAEALGDRFFSRNCRVWLGIALMMQGDLHEAERVGGSLAEESEAAGDLVMKVFGYVVRGVVLRARGKTAAAREAAQSALVAAEAMGGTSEDTVHAILADPLWRRRVRAAARMCEAAWRYMNTLHPQRAVFTRGITPTAEAALACGDWTLARRWADDTVAVVPGWHRMVALTTRALVATAQGESGAGRARRP